MKLLAFPSLCIVRLTLWTIQNMRTNNEIPIANKILRGNNVE